ncbi:hypothetical protein [Tepidimicrobium xylanilyticum]
MNKDKNIHECDGKIEFDLNHIREVDCVIVDKVYAQCQSRQCFPSLEVETKNGTFSSIQFKQGFIVPNTLRTDNIPNRPNFKRVRFTLRIPYIITLSNGQTIENNLPDIDKDIILFIPEARDEFQFNIVTETSSKVLGQPVVMDDRVVFAAGVFIIIKVVGRVQLLIPTFGFCPEPPPCQEFAPEDVCDDFDNQPFPLFFPLQYGDLFGDD